MRILKKEKRKRKRKLYCNNKLEGTRTLPVMGVQV